MAIIKVTALTKRGNDLLKIHYTGDTSNVKGKSAKLFKVVSVSDDPITFYIKTKWIVDQGLKRMGGFKEFIKMELANKGILDEDVRVEDG